MEKIIIKYNEDIPKYFQKTEIGKKLYVEVLRLYDLDEYYSNIEEDTEEIRRAYIKVHKEFCKAHDLYESKMKEWLMAGIEDGSIIDEIPYLG